MSSYIEDEGLPGGGVFALTTSEAYIDLSAFEGYSVYLACASQNWLMSFAPAGTAAGSLVTTAQAASLTALVSDLVGATIKVKRVVGKNTILVAKTVTGSDTLYVKPIRKAAY